MRLHLFSRIFFSLAFFIISNVYGIEILKKCTTRSQAYNFSSGKHSGKFMVVANGKNGVTKFEPFIDSTFCNPFLANNNYPHFPTHGFAYDVKVVHDPVFSEPVLFVADGDSGLLVLLSDSGTAWFIQKRYPVPGKAKTLDFFNNSVLVAGDSGLFIFSVPCTTGIPCSLIGRDLSLTFSERTYCRLAEDISIPASSVPQLAYAYIMTENGNIVFCSITKPERAEYIIETLYDTCALSVDKNGVAYTASFGVFSSYDVIFSYAIKDPPTIGHNPPNFQRMLFGGHGEDIYLFDRYAYLAVRKIAASNSFNGVLVYDISDFRNPIFIDSCRTQGNAYGLFVDSSHIYLADGDSGIVVMSNTVFNSNIQSRPRIINPSNSLFRFDIFKRSIVFQFSIKATSFVSLKIFSINGKVCHTLVKNLYNSGDHTISWNYYDNSNKAVASGIYYAVLEINDNTISSPFVKF